MQAKDEVRTDEILEKKSRWE